MIQAHDNAALHSLLAREQRAPRYTSYPTAMEFSTHFGVDDYRAAVARTNEEPVPAPLSLYLHIPFCASACYYCGCHRIISRNPKTHERYLQALHREIALQGALFAKDRPVRQIHFGGGTPNLLRPRQLGQLLNRVLQHFQLAEDCEISLEVDPRQYQARDAQAWALLGFNRISLGVQDTDPLVQKLINRRQSSTGIRTLVEEARRAGIDSVNFDLIYGLPGQSPGSFTRTLDFVEQTRPERIAIYHYAHMPARFPAQRAIAAAQLPGLESAFTIHAHARQRLLAAGYVHIGMDHYALPDDALARARNDGSLRRNFQGYTVLGDCDLVGMGVSAISRIGDVMAQNHAQLEAYEERLNASELAVNRGLLQSFEDRLRADVIEQIMCQGLLNFRQIAQTWCIDFTQVFGADLEKLRRLDPDARWVRLSADGLAVTDTGRDFLRLIAQCFDAYAERRGDRSAKPVVDLREVLRQRQDARLP